MRETSEKTSINSLVELSEGASKTSNNMYMPRSKELPPELSKRFTLSSPRDTPWSRILGWIDALLMDAGCLYDLNGKLIRANGKFGRMWGKALKKSKTPAWMRIAKRYKWHIWNGKSDW